MTSIKYSFLWLGMALTVHGCTSAPIDPVMAFQGQSAEQLYHAGGHALANAQYNQASKLYEALDILYPFNVHTEQAQLNLMYSYYKQGEMALAAATAEHFIRLYPRSYRVDYAYYMKGLANFNQDRSWLHYMPIDVSWRDPGTMQQAFADFRRLLSISPHSPYCADARQRMIYLRNLLARHELHIADYYLRKKAYMAAINRARYVLQYYQGTPEVRQALVIMSKAYRALGLTDLAKQTIQIAALNGQAIH